MGLGRPLSLNGARRLVEDQVEHYNHAGFQRATGSVAPKDMPARHQNEIQAERDRKLEAAGQ